MTDRPRAQVTAMLTALRYSYSKRNKGIFNFVCSEQVIGQSRVNLIIVKAIAMQIFNFFLHFLKNIFIILFLVINYYFFLNFTFIFIYFYFFYFYFIFLILIILILSKSS